MIATLSLDLLPPTAARLKEEALICHLSRFDEVLVAFSGGVDSTYLLDVAHEALRERVIAVTADSPSLAREELQAAEWFCRSRGIRHQVVKTHEFDNPDFLANNGQRCGHCKSALMHAMSELAQKIAHPGAVLLLGAIANDLHDHRPGMRAAGLAGAQWPMADMGLTKDEVRERSRARDLPTWNRPASPCLASRVPYGEPITITGLAMIEHAERILHSAGFPECRARHHAIGGGRGFLCRIEVPLNTINYLMHHRERLVAEIRALGYLSVCVDLAGFTSGSFNRLLATGDQAQA